MSAPAILAIDAGTTNVKAVLVAADGRVLRQAAQAVTMDYPRPGWAEQSATALWEAVQAVVARIVSDADALPVALAIANQRETVMIWDAASGEPLAPAISWQCGRTAARCAALRDAGHAARIAELSGLAIDPMFPAAKLAWLLDHVPDARARAADGTLRAGTVDAFLLARLTGGAVHATDHSNAARTQLYDLEQGGWSAELAGMFDVPLAILPEILPSDAAFGTLAAGTTALPEGTPVRAMLGDSHAALFRHSRHWPGALKATIGTGSSLMLATDARARSRHGLSGTVAWSRSGAPVRQALEGNIRVSGEAAAFAARLLGLADAAALAELAATVEDSGGLVFVPALAGLGAPHWQPGARGTLSGMTLATTPAQVARATLEAIALQIADVADAMAADSGQPVAALLIDGGAAMNDALAQLLADLSGRTIVRPHGEEASALGVAMLAADALGIAADTAAPGEDRFRPMMESAAREAIVARWRRAVAAVVAAG